MFLLLFLMQKVDIVSPIHKEIYIYLHASYCVITSQTGVPPCEND